MFSFSNLDFSYITLYLNGLNEEETKSKIKRLFNIYKRDFKTPIHKNIIQEVGHALTTKYLAKIVYDNYVDLINLENKEPHISATQPLPFIPTLIMYEIGGAPLEEAYTEEEKKTIKTLKNKGTNTINIIFVSTNGKYVSAVTTKGVVPQKIKSLLFVLLTEMKEEYYNLSDPWFCNYLLHLECAGYIIDEGALGSGNNIETNGMKNVVLSADGHRIVYSVPAEVANKLYRYCTQFDGWLTKSPHAKKYLIDGVLCFGEADFIEYLNTWVFPNKSSKFIENLGWIDFDEPLPSNYKNCPWFNF